MLCANCHQALLTGLTFADDPPRAFYDGADLHLPRGQVSILRRLARTGRATFGQLHSSRDTLRVQIHNMRGRLPKRVAIVAVTGWGYELAIAG